MRGPAPRGMLDHDRKPDGIQASGSQEDMKETHMSTNQMSPNTAKRQIADRMTVYAMDGEKLGTVRNYDPEAGYLDIQKGRLFPKDFFVGLAAITSIDEEGITLRLTKEDLKDDRFAAPPMRGGLAYSEGFVGTEKEPVDVVDEEVPVTRTSGSGPVY
jgi:hypothetical protein